MTEQERVWQRFNELPADAQKQVADLINFLYNHLGAEPVAQTGQVKAEQLEFFGIWRGREDLADSSAWLRELRERDWSPHR